MDRVFCTDSDELYQLYLSSVGVEDAFVFLCENDTFSGLSRSLLQKLESHEVNFGRHLISLNTYTR